MKAAFMKGNYGPGDVRRLVPNGVIVSVQVFIGYIETNPLWHVLNGFFIFGGLGAISMSLARGLHHTASESTLFHTPYVSPTDITLSLASNKQRRSSTQVSHEDFAKARLFWAYLLRQCNVEPCFVLDKNSFDSGFRSLGPLSYPRQHALQSRRALCGYRIICDWWGFCLQLSFLPHRPRP
jgi:hypothetical protein